MTELSFRFPSGSERAARLSEDGSITVEADLQEIHRNQVVTDVRTDRSHRVLGVEKLEGGRLRLRLDPEVEP